MILDLLNFKLKELSGENEYKVIKLIVDEEKQEGLAVIKNISDNTLSNWYWHKELAWVKTEDKNKFKFK